MLQTLKSIFPQRSRKCFFRISATFRHSNCFFALRNWNKITFDRDISMQEFFEKNNIIWNQFQMHGIIRKLKSRQNWDKH